MLTISDMSVLETKVKVDETDVSRIDIGDSTVIQIDAFPDTTFVGRVSEISNSSIKAVPQNGYGQLNGQTAFTHGVEFGVTKASTRDLAEATKAWLNAVAQNNPDLRLSGQQQAIKMSQRSALSIPTRTQQSSCLRSTAAPAST